MKSQKLVLVIEDDLDIRETLKMALELEGYEVHTAANGKEGLDQVKAGPQPSLILLDMMMPIMDGREFLDAILADEKLAPIPVIIVSADIDLKRQEGARAYMKKPADLNLLLDWVERYST